MVAPRTAASTLTPQDLLKFAVALEHFERAADAYAKWLVNGAHKLSPSDVARVRAEFGDALLYARGEYEMLNEEMKVG